MSHLTPWASRKGEAKPLPEPAIRTRKTAKGRRIGTTLPTETYQVQGPRGAAACPGALTGRSSPWAVCL